EGVVVHADLVEQATTGARPVDDQDVRDAVGDVGDVTHERDVSVRRRDGGVGLLPGRPVPHEQLELVAGRRRAGPDELDGAAGGHLETLERVPAAAALDLGGGVRHRLLAGDDERGRHRV